MAIGSVVDQFVVDQLPHPCLDAVHALDPGQGIGGLQGFGEALGAGQLGGQAVGHGGGVGVDGVEMAFQLTRKKKVVIERPVVGFEVGQAASAPEAQGLGGGVVISGDQVVVAHQFVVETRARVGDVFLHTCLLSVSVDPVLQLVPVEAVVLADDVVDGPDLGDVVGGADHEVLHQALLQEPAGGDVGDAAQHGAELRQGQQVGIVFELPFILKSGHGSYLL